MFEGHGTGVPTVVTNLRNISWLCVHFLRRSIPESVNVSVKHCNIYSDVCDSYIGLKQGEVLSPLFSHFIEDL
jgi:hypothetical protein